MTLCEAISPYPIIGNETDVDIDAMDAETEGEEDTEE